MILLFGFISFLFGLAVGFFLGGYREQTKKEKKTDLYILGKSDCENCVKMRTVDSTGWVRCSEFTTLYDKPKHCNRYKRIEPQNEYHSNCKKYYMKRPRAAVEIPAPPDEWSDDMKRLYKSVIDSLTGDSE